jgi:type I restriction enzyme R subunit
LFSNKEAIEVVTMPAYEAIAEKFDEALELLREIAPTYQSVNDLERKKTKRTLYKPQEIDASDERIAILH